MSNASFFDKVYNPDVLSCLANLTEQTKDIPGGRRSDWQIHSLLQPGKKQEWRR